MSGLLPLFAVPAGRDVLPARAASAIVTSLPRLAQVKGSEIQWWQACFAGRPHSTDLAFITPGVANSSAAKFAHARFRSGSRFRCSAGLQPSTVAIKMLR